MANPDTIKDICRSLRACQGAIAQKITPKELVYYRGNVSNVELECLDGNNWLNDTIVNRYMEMISRPPFIAISSFFIESFNAMKKCGPEKLPGNNRFIFFESTPVLLHRLPQFRHNLAWYIDLVVLSKR